MKKKREFWVTFEVSHGAEEKMPDVLRFRVILLLTCPREAKWFKQFASLTYFVATQPGRIVRTRVQT